MNNPYEKQKCEVWKVILARALAFFRTTRWGPPVHKCNAPVLCQTWELSLAKLTVFFNEEQSQFDQQQLSLLDKTDASQVQTDRSGRPFLTKFKHPYSDILAQLFYRYNQDLKFR